MLISLGRSTLIGALLEPAKKILSRLGSTPDRKMTPGRISLSDFEIRDVGVGVGAGVTWVGFAATYERRGFELWKADKSGL